MSWSDPVDLYCERTSAAFWAEPVNALTNAAFLLAAFAAFVQWRRAGGRDLPVLALIMVLIAIAFGSFAFHTLATRGAAYFDVIPIAIFIYGFLALALRRFLSLPWPATVLALAMFFAVTRTLQWLFRPATLNGSLDYVPAMAAMLLLVWFVPVQVRPAIWLATALFIVSLSFRTVDQAICSAFPLGTHFIWHVLNAAVLFVLLNAAIAHGPRAAAAIGQGSWRNSAL
jgi:hypothetical protein